MKTPSLFLFAAFVVIAADTALAQAPAYTGGVQPDLKYHDGGLRWVVGVQNVQVVRSAADNPGATDGYDAIYRHHPFLCYWGGLFWVLYDGPGTRVCWSANGYDWSIGDSSLIFPGGHHRMAFYVASNNRLLASHYRGTRNGGLGMRHIREIYGPNSYGPIYAVKTNYLGAGPYTNWPAYTTSPDRPFVAACEELVSDRLFRQQWQEEDQDPVFYTISTNGGNRVWKAFNWYRLPDERIVGLWKNNYMTVTKGSDWNPGNVPDPSRADSFRWHPGAKIWGERSADGRYAMIGCASNGDTQRRWPLAAAISADGINFNAPFLVIAGDMPPQRYENDPGDDKNCGPQYVRGISPGNGDPPGTDLWLTYSMNKEDIWVASVPTPILGQATNDVWDDFQHHSLGRRVEGWNLYSPQWAPVTITAEGTNRFVRLEDRDPCDYASVTRVFPQNSRARLSFDIRIHQAVATSAPLEIDVVSSNGTRAVALAFNGGQMTAWNVKDQQKIGRYSANEWFNMEVIIDTRSRGYSVKVNGSEILTNAPLLESAADVERIQFRTGEFRLRDFNRRRHTEPFLTTRISNADMPEPPRRFDIDNVRLSTSDRITQQPWENPARHPIQELPGVPRVLLIGDSISNGYTLSVRERLVGKANVHRIPENGGSTTNGLARLDAWLCTQHWDVIHFNWGLHDLKLMDSGQQQVALTDYERNLNQLVQRLRQTGARLIWASTTPVPEGKLGTLRRSTDVPLYNEMSRNVIPSHRRSIGTGVQNWIRPRLIALRSRLYPAGT